MKAGRSISGKQAAGEVRPSGLTMMFGDGSSTVMIDLRQLLVQRVAYKLNLRLVGRRELDECDRAGRLP